MGGYNQYACVGHEAVWGTEVARDAFHKVFPDTLITPNKPREGVTFLGQRDEDSVHDGLESANMVLAIPFTYSAGGIELLLYYLLGQYATSGADPYTHVFSVDNNPYSRGTTPLIGLSMEANHELPETGFEAMLATGCRMRGGSMSIVAGEEIPINFDVIAKQAIAEPKTGTPTFPDYDGADLVKASQVTVEIGDAATTVYDVEFTIANSLREDKGVLGAAFIGDPRALGRREITGVFNKEWADKTLFNQWLSGATAKLEVICTGPDDFLCTFLWPKVRYTGAPPAMAEAEEQESSVPGKAYYDASNSAMEITLINNTQTPFTP